MKNKKILAIGLICLMAFVIFSGCGDTPENGNTDTGLTAKEIVAKSADSMKDIDNYKATMAMDMEMSAEGETIAMNMDATIDAFMDPLKMKMVMDMSEPTTGNIKMDTYIIHEGDNLVTYINMMGQWLKSTQPFSQELMDQYTQTQYTQLFNDSLKEATIVAEEAINGVDCWKVDIVIDAATMLEVLEGMQGGEDLASMIPDEMLAQMSDMTSTVWISKDNFYQMRMDMDMSSMMAAAMEEMGVELSKLAITMTMSDFDNATDFTLPDEAQNAMETAL